MTGDIVMYSVKYIILYIYIYIYIYYTIVSKEKCTMDPVHWKVTLYQRQFTFRT